MKVGFTTGIAYQSINPLSTEAINICGKISTANLEINCVGGLDIGDISADKIPPEDLEIFKSVSLHAPCKDFVVRDDAKTRTILDRIQEMTRKTPFAFVLFHPDLIEDCNVLLEYTFPIAIENMDKRKKFGLTANDLKRFFDIINCKFVLDVNHCFTIDPSMQLACELTELFSDRLVGVHLSGYANYHDPLFQTKQGVILDHIPVQNIPITIESVFTGLNLQENMQREYDYVMRYLKQRCH